MQRTLKTCDLCEKELTSIEGFTVLVMDNTRVVKQKQLDFCSFECMSKWADAQKSSDQ
jgi:hypothetical protein